MLTKYLSTYPNINKFQSLLTLYKDWNSKINISSIKEEKDIIIKHFVDSLYWNEVLDFSWKKILDVWTWWWFPILPLAIVNEDADFVWLDSVKKKLWVIKDIAKQVGLNNVSLIHGRAEDFGQDANYREKFDIVIVRAFAKWSSMLEMTLPFLKRWWMLLAYQTSSIDDDLGKGKKTLKVLWWELLDSLSFDLPEDYWNRRIVLIEKVSKTPWKFPRQVWIPKSNPL